MYQSFEHTINGVTCLITYDCNNVEPTHEAEQEWKLIAVRPMPGVNILPLLTDWRSEVTKAINARYITDWLNYKAKLRTSKIFAKNIDLNDILN